MELVFATNNQHKLAEIKKLLQNRFIIKSLDDIGCRQEIPEDQPTLEGNALQKAMFVYRHFGLNCFADDTGLEVEALNGEPGVLSARYAGAENNADNNIRKLLDTMAEIKNRNARFRTLISLVIDGNATFFEGMVKGTILYEKRGQKGFGYDPVFCPEGSTFTFAEIDLATKNKISHRGLAFEKLVSFLYNEK
jgi:XTP/dITP diphosphohydrolase